MNGRIEEPEQLPDGIFDAGTDMRLAPACEDVFVPFQVVAEESTNRGVTPTPPTHVTVRYMSPTGMRTVHVPWCGGMTVEGLFRRAKMQDTIFRQVNPLGFARVIDKRRVRLNQQINPGDVVKLNPRDLPFM